MPITFYCPHCTGKATGEVKLAGMVRCCQHCGKAIQLPLTSGMATKPVNWPPPNWGARVALAMAIAAPWVFSLAMSQPSNESVRRLQCLNNLKQIGLAMHNYHSEHAFLPPAYTIDAHGKPLHSWRTLLLPYLEQRALYDKIRLDEPWDSPYNQQFHSLVIYSYKCPNSTDGDTNAHAAVPVGDDAPFPPDGGQRSLDDIEDVPETLLVYEIGKAGHWMKPLEADANMLLPPANEHGESLHVAFGDGSVHSVPKMTLEELRKLTKSKLAQ